MELVHFCTLDPKAIYKSIVSGRIENMNKNIPITCKSLGILLSLKQRGGHRGFSSLIRVLSGNVSSALCGLGA